MTEPGAPTGGKAPNLAANGINDAGAVAGSYTTSGGVTTAFLKLPGGAFHKIAVPGASSTAAFGVNDNDTVVGTYTDGSGWHRDTHGFIWRIGGSLTTNVDDPNGIGDDHPQRHQQRG